VSAMTSIRIVVKPTAGGDKINRDVEASSTIREVKEQLAEACSISADDQRLIYKGQILKDERTVKSYGRGTRLLEVSWLGFAWAPVTGISWVLQVLATIMCCTWCVASRQGTRRGKHASAVAVAACWLHWCLMSCSCLVGWLLLQQLCRCNVFYPSSSTNSSSRSSC
jgi:hypothetical protein